MIANTRRGQASLFLEILDWMLVPLLVVWPASVIATYLAAQSIANGPYDRALFDDVNAVARLVHAEGPEIHVDVQAANRRLLHSDDVDEVYFQVRDHEGERVAGNPGLSGLPLPDAVAPGGVRFRNERLDGNDARVAYMWLAIPSPRSPLLVEVVETTRKREHLAAEMVSGIVLPQFAFMPLAAVLVWFGLHRGTRPLVQLQEHIGARRPGDLSPMDLKAVPEEIVPLIRSINELMARLDANLKAQQRFTANAAHQLRTPLAGLKMQAELALRQGEWAEVQHSLQQIDASAERARHLVNQLLALAHAEAQAEAQAEEDRRQRLATFDLAACVREVAGEWVPEALGKRIDLGVEEPGGPLRVRASEPLLRELVANLLDNAIRYTPEGGRVTARVSGDVARVLIEVEDNGIGVDPAERELVFQRFYRVDGTGVSGSGLGLAIVRSIADQHGGSVVVDAGPGGVGAVFRVTLPRRSAEP